MLPNSSRLCRLPAKSPFDRHFAPLPTPTMAPPAAESASPIGIANLPNQRHKIVAKRGAAFTIMVGISVGGIVHRGQKLTYYRLLASPGWERLPSSTLSSPLLLRTTQTTSADMLSRSTRPWRLRSPRPSWKRSFSRVCARKYQNILNLRSLTTNSSFDCY